MNILADASLPNVSELFPHPFHLTLYDTTDDVANMLSKQDILLCRSTLKVTAQLLAGSQLQCVATASSGVDHIDINYLTKQGISLFDAKGCNAQSVADYVVATLAFLYRNNKMKGNKAGIIGVGAVGEQVKARLLAAGFNVICYDPIRATLDDQHSYGSLTELTSCDLLCIHANLHDTQPFPSVNLLTHSFLTQLKPNTVIINAARGGIVNESALLKLDKPLIYCTDVYNNEPAINAEVVNFSTLCTPHIAGHSIEAKNAAVLIISQKLHHHYGLPIPAEPNGTKLRKNTDVAWMQRSVIREARPREDTIPGLRFAASRLHKSLNLVPLTAKSTDRSKITDWQDYVLTLYNPLNDTQVLKEAHDKTLAFLAQRKAHQNRHDFSFYDASQFDHQTRGLLGTS